MRNDFNGNYLAHYGTKGMKWGVRRYQNPDGSLTPAGREHYGYSSNQSGDAKEVATAVKKKAKASYNTAVNKSAKKKNTKAMKEARSKNVDEMSTQELRDYNNRLQEEQRFRNLTESDQTKARRWVKNIGKESAKVVLSAALVILGKKFLGIGNNDKDGNLKDTANNLKNKALITATNAKNSAQNFVTDFKSAYNEEMQRQAHEQAVRMHQQAHDTAVRTHQQMVEQNQRDQDMINQQNQMIFQQQAMMPMMFGGKKLSERAKQARIDRRVARFEKKADTRQRQADDYRNGKTVTNAMVSRIRSLVKSGKTQEEIAAALHISVSSVNKYAR